MPQKKRERENTKKFRWYNRVATVFTRRYVSARNRIDAFLARRPHRSFRRTLRRDYKRGLRVPGYFALTGQTLRVLWRHKKLFGLLVLFYGVLSLVLVGLASQTTFTQLQAAFDETSEGLYDGAWGQVSRAGLLLAAGVFGSFTPELTEAQQIYSGLLVLLVWLTTVWLLRVIYAGSEPRLRDALYSAGAPIVATALVAVYMLLQSIPLVAGVLIIGSLGTVGGAIALLFGVAAFLLITLSVYWLTGSFMALVVSTLPGMYPWRAIQIAGDIVVGRRLRILLRILWLIGTVLVLWLVLVLPAILIEGWIVDLWEWFENVPFVPIVLLVVTSLSAVWASAYIYTFYRKVVDDDEKPA